MAAFEESLGILKAAFRHLEAKLPSPELTQVYGRVYPRYSQRTVEQAALQKMARYLSGLKAITILLSHRMLQEDGVIKRTLDELGEDIMFLLMKPQTPQEVALQKKYLDGFYQEVFDEGVAAIDSTKRRKSVRRSEVQNYIQRRTVGVPPKSERASPLIYHVYSGYVHGASPHIMEMCSMDDLKFELFGVRDVDLFESHVRDAVNYFIRGFYSLGALGSVMGEDQMYHQLKARGDALEHKWD